MRAMSFSRKVTVIATTRRYKQKWAQTAHQKTKKPLGGLFEAHGVDFAPPRPPRPRPAGARILPKSGRAVEHLIKGARQRSGSALSRQGYVQGAKLLGCPSHYPRPR